MYKSNEKMSLGEEEEENKKKDLLEPSEEGGLAGTKLKARRPGRRLQEG